MGQDGEIMASESPKRSNNTIGLAMTGGGARGAYQAGVLKRIGEIKKFEGKAGPFTIIGGASAGAVNGAALAAGNHDFQLCTRWISQLWSHLHTKDVYRSDFGSLIPKAGRWLRDLSVGAIFGGGHAHSLLDASPLPIFLGKYLNCESIHKNVERGNIKALSIAATNYSSGKTFFFVQGKDIPMWAKSRRVSVATEIRVEHICASAAIPIVFQPVRVAHPYGADFFGDGCLRLTTPLSPVIRLGADRLLAIGVRTASPTEDQPSVFVETPPLAQILGTTLNAIFLDHLDADVEHLERLNQIVTKAHITAKNLEGISEPIKTVIPLVIKPSDDLGKVAENFTKNLPIPVRYLMEGLGTRKTPSADLMSYLLFDPDYTRALIDMGYKDANTRIDEIENFLFASNR